MNEHWPEVARVTVTQGQIDRQLEKAWAAIDTGNGLERGMSYEEGVIAALAWVTGKGGAAPMND